MSMVASMGIRLLIFMVCYGVIVLVIFLCPLILVLQNVLQLRKRRRVGGP